MWLIDTIWTIGGHLLVRFLAIFDPHCLTFFHSTLCKIFVPGTFLLHFVSRSLSNKYIWRLWWMASCKVHFECHPKIWYPIEQLNIFIRTSIKKMRTNIASNGAPCLHPYLSEVIYQYYYKHTLENNRKRCFVIIWLKLEVWIYLTVIYRMSKYCLLISPTRFNNIFWTFCLRRNNKCEWFVEINGALLQYVAVNC